MEKLKGNIMLLIAALIWGSAFVSQSVGMDYVGPFTFITFRYFVGCIFLLPCIYIIHNINSKKINKSNNIKLKDRKDSIYIKGGIYCGIVLFIASSFQQIGMKYTTASKSGFITALYIIIVPLLGILFKKKVNHKVWIGVGISLLGMYMLCINENFEMNIGDILTLICAFCFSIHILIIDYFSPKVDGVKMSCVQFFVSGVLGIIPMVIFEDVQMVELIGAMTPILYAGVMSSGVAYTLQIVGQKYTSPVLATMIMSLESVFAAISGWLILNERLSAKELIGCALVFTAIIIAQMPESKKVIKSERY